MYWTRLEDLKKKKSIQKKSWLSNDNKVSLLASKPQDFKSDSS